MSQCAGNVTWPTHLTTIYPTQHGEYPKRLGDGLITQTINLASTPPYETTNTTHLRTFLTDYLITFLQKIAGESLPDSWSALRFLYQPPIDNPLDQLLNKTHPA